MDKTIAGAVVAAAGAIWRQERPCTCGTAGFFDLNSMQLISPCTREVNKPSPFRVRAVKIHEKLAQQPWPNTSTMDSVDLEKPIERVDHIWERCMGCGSACRVAFTNTIFGTCVLVACTVCVEAVHRLQHEKLHGKGTTFPYRAAPPDDLLEACRNAGIWKPGEGADVGDVLNKIREMGGVPATIDAPTPAQRLLPLRLWEEHRWDDFAATALSPGRVADLLYNNGPCIGLLCVSPSYHHCVADDGDNALVYTSGCGRSDDARRMIEELYPGQVIGWHAVVCFGFRRGGKHVLVLDNHTRSGPRRWVDVKEFHTLYTLRV